MIDYSSVRTSQNIIFENSLYSLGTLDKKVDSLTSQKTTSMRQRERNELLHPDNVLQGQNGRPAPIHLANDLSKHLNNRVTGLQTVALCATSSGQSKDLVNQIILGCVQRFKNEHEDDGSLGVELRQITPSQPSQETASSLFLEELMQQVHLWLRTTLEVTKHEVIAAQLTACRKAIQAQATDLGAVKSFLKTISEQMQQTLDCSRGSALINYLPAAQQLNACIHPMLLAIHQLISQQVKTHPDPEPIQPEALLPESIFPSIWSHKACRVTFINLDGKDTPLNILLAKVLHQHLQYISFPLDASDALCSQFVLDELSPDQIDYQRRVFKVKEPRSKDFLEYCRRLLVVPLSSKALSYGQDLPNIDPFHSTFISLMMQEVIYQQIRNFSPSLIVISHSGSLALKAFHLEAMLKELAVISNMKLILYNNFTGSQWPIHTLLHQHQTSWHQSFPTEVLHLMNSYLKICSGTESLHREEGPQQKYEIYRVMDYAGKMLRIVSKHHPALEPSRHKFLEYFRRHKLLTNSLQTSLNQHNFSAFSHQLIERTHDLFSKPEPQYMALIDHLRQRYGSDLGQHWACFVQGLALRQAKQQKERRVKHVAKLPLYPPQPDCYDLIALEFAVQDSPGRAIKLNSKCQVVLPKTRCTPVTSVFVFNHLPHRDSFRLRNYVGVIDKGVQSSCEGRVELKEMTILQQEYELNPHQYLVEFNLAETAKSVILFWPMLFDERASLLHQLAGITYHPQITSLILLANRSRLDQFVAVHSDHSHVHPRTSCTPFQPSHSEKIFIFGGFYSGSKDYLDFQTDITIMELSQNGLQVNNIPKAFYYDANNHQQGSSLATVNCIHNDLVRPRTEYEVLLKTREGDFCEVMLVGGVGEHYLRPFCLLSNTAQVLTFHQDQLVSIKKIKLNGLVVANLSRPLRCKGDASQLAINSAQNRRITTVKALGNANSLSWMSHNLRYIPEEQKVVSSKRYELKMRQVEPDNDWSLIRDHQHFSIQHSSQSAFQLKGYTPEKQFDVILNLGFGLDQETRQKFVNVQDPLIPLGKENVLALHCNFGQIYGLVQHPIYTQGRIILARSDLSRPQFFELHNQQLVELRELYCFDRQFGLHALTVLDKQKIAIVHGCHFQSLYQFTQTILSKDSTGFFYSEPVQTCQESNKMICETVKGNKVAKDGQRLSFVFGQKDRLLCISILELKEDMWQEYLFIVEELPLNKQTYNWKLVHHFTVCIQLQQQLQKTQSAFKINDLIEESPENEDKLFWITVTYEHHLFRGSFRLENNSTQKIIRMQPTDFTQTQKWMNCASSNLGQKIDKSNMQHEAATQIDIEQR